MTKKKIMHNANSKRNKVYLLIFIEKTCPTRVILATSSSESLPVSSIGTNVIMESSQSNDILGLQLTLQDASSSSTTHPNIHGMSQSSFTNSQRQADITSQPKIVDIIAERQTKSSEAVQNPVPSRNARKSDTSAKRSDSKTATATISIVPNELKQHATPKAVQVPEQSKNTQKSDTSAKRRSNIVSSTASISVTTPDTRPSVSSNTIIRANSLPASATRTSSTPIVATSSTPKRIRKRKNCLLRDSTPRKRGRRYFVYVDIDQLFSQSWKGNAFHFLLITSFRCSGVTRIWK